MQYQRSNFCFFYFDNARAFDPSQTDAEGNVSWVLRRGAFAVSVLGQTVLHLELEVLQAIYQMERNRWHELATWDALSPQELDRLSRGGVLLCDGDDPAFERLRTRHADLETQQWHPYSALYYFMSQWRRPLPEGTDHDQEIDDPSLLVERLGTPPPTFHHRTDRLGYEPLELDPDPSPFFQRLTRRRSRRTFDVHSALPRRHLSNLLYYVWGCQGRMDFAPGVELLKKTSPSGGALHPVEVYPLVCNVEGLAPGLYHYDVEGHGLELIEPMEMEAARDLAVEATVGQIYFRDVQVAFLMTARFYRNFWKYHRIDKALSVVLMDSACLAQTFYLAADELGLAALYTAAVNALTFEQHLGLDGVDEGPITVVACGAPHPEADRLEPDFTPFRPGSSG